jgi:hypothetical protein
MEGLEVTVLLGLSVLAGTILAPRLRVATPLVLLVIGLVLGFVPALRHRAAAGDGAAAVPARDAVLGEPDDVAAGRSPVAALHHPDEHPARGRLGVRGRVGGHALRAALAGSHDPRCRRRAPDATAVAALGRLLPSARS